jgi:hypothetical protein
MRIQASPRADFPPDFIAGALQAAYSCFQLARALNVPRNGAFRLVQGSFAFAAFAGAFTLGTDGHAGATASTLNRRCSIAAMLVLTLRSMLTVCQPPRAAAEVFAAAAPPDKLLLLLRVTAGQMLEGLEAGANIQLRVIRLGAGNVACMESVCQSVCALQASDIQALFMGAGTCILPQTSAWITSTRIGW